MFQASRFLATKWSGVHNKSQLNAAAPINYVESAQILSMLTNYGASCLYSSIISVADAIRGLESGFYSWSGIKLYYSVFYALRASLAFSGISVFYIDKKGYWSDIIPGSRLHAPPSGAGSSSHKIVLMLFAQRGSACNLLSQPIAGKEPLKWLQDTREELNYVNAKFVEPRCPEYFKYLNHAGIRRLLTSHFQDEELRYAFDPEHALMAFPIETLKFVTKYRTPRDIFSEFDRDYLKSIIVDRHGRLSNFDQFADI